MSTNSVLKNLINVRKAFSSNSINQLFIEQSLIWIKNKANSNLDSRTQGFWGSDAREWKIEIFNSFGILKNEDMNSGAIEFGIGSIGESLTNKDTQIVARENNYQYNVPSESKDDNGYWTFKDARHNIWITFKGYEGKSFLYDALMEYIQTKQWIIIYRQSFDKIMGGIIK